MEITIHDGQGTGNEQQAEKPKMNAQIIPFHVPTPQEVAEHKKEEAMKVSWHRCSFCGTYPPKGTFIESGVVDKNIRDEKVHAVICFGCVQKAAARIQEATNE